MEKRYAHIFMHCIYILDDSNWPEWSWQNWWFSYSWKVVQLLVQSGASPSPTGHVDSKARGGRNRCISSGRLGRIGNYSFMFLKPRRRCFQLKSPSTKCFLSLFKTTFGIHDNTHFIAVWERWCLCWIWFRKQVSRNFEVHPLQEGKSMSLVVFFRIFLRWHEWWRAELHFLVEHDDMTPWLFRVYGVYVLEVESRSRFFSGKSCKISVKLNFPGDEIV